MILIIFGPMNIGNSPMPQPHQLVYRLNHGPPFINADIGAQLRTAGAVNDHCGNSVLVKVQVVLFAQW